VLCPVGSQQQKGSQFRNTYLPVYLYVEEYPGQRTLPGLPGLTGASPVCPESGYLSGRTGAVMPASRKATTSRMPVTAMLYCTPMWSATKPTAGGPARNAT
jgi:hypothetical protein